MRLALDRVTVERGSALFTAHAILDEGLHVIHGPVGSGKSSLALVIAGLVKPSSGSVHRDGIRSSILSLQFPEYHVTGSTLLEECASWGIDPVPALSSAGLLDRADQNPLSVSRGELKRLHLACVLAKPCDLLVLDEPFSALDCGQKEILCNRLSERTSGITIIFTHEHEILPPAARFWEILGGRLAIREMPVRPSLPRGPDPQSCPEG